MSWSTVELLKAVLCMAALGYLMVHLTIPRHAAPSVRLLTCCLLAISIASTPAYSREKESNGKLIPSSLRASGPAIAAEDIGAVCRLVASRVALGCQPCVPASDTSNSLDYPGPVYLALRANGEKLTDTWIAGGSWATNIDSALERTVSGLSPDEVARFDSIEICLTHAYRPIDLRHNRGRVTNIHRGVRGIAFLHKARIERYGPTEMIAKNRAIVKCR